VIRRVLVVGLGGIGQRHVRNLRALCGPGLDILACRSRGHRTVVTETLDVEPGADVEEKYAIRSFTDLDAALAERPEAVLVCNPSSLHGPAARAAAEAGCHVFVEKPLSHSLDGIDELADLLERKRLVGLVGYQLRFHPVLRRVHELLTAGALGPLLSVRMVVAEYLPGFHRYEDYRGMYASRRDLGGGVVLSQIHELDYAGWLFGPPRRVFALGGHLSSLQIDVEDVASILLDCGTEARRFPVHLLQDYVQRPPARGCEIVGDVGKIVVDLRAPGFERFDEGGASVEKMALPGFDRNSLFLDEMKHFLACVEGREQPVVSVREGASSLSLALAVRRSLETGAVVETPAPGAMPR